MKKLGFTVITLIIFYTILELIFYGINCFSVVGVSHFEGINKKNIVFDSIRGFRFLPGEARTVLIMNDEIEFDTKFSINNVGVPSRRDYQKKKRKGVKRYIVFGDSFTQGYFLGTNWPDRLNKTFEKDSIEFYNFAVDGGGLMNWHNTYFKEIVGQYAFDGIIIASYGNNLHRDFWVMYPDYEKEMMRGGHISPIPSRTEEISGELIHSGAGLYKTDEQINEALEKLIQREFQWKPLDTYFLTFIKQRVKNLFRKTIVEKEEEKFDTKFLGQVQKKYDFDDFIERYGEEKHQLLDTLISHAKAHQKEIILVNIPDIKTVTKSKVEVLSDHERKTPANILVQEMMFLADHFETDYFNGYEIFQGKPKRELPQYWLNQDGHWNEKGSDLFAEKFAEHLSNKSK